MRFIRRTLPFALFATLAACEGGVTPPPVDLPVGTVLIEVTGDTTFTVQGTARYNAPQMTLTDQQGPQDLDYIQLLLETPATPQERRYNGLTTGSVLFLVRGGSIVRQWQSTTGWLDLYEVTGGNVSGDAEITAEEYDFVPQVIPGNRITVRAYFNASRP